MNEVLKYNSVAIWSAIEYKGICIKQDQSFVTVEDYNKLLEKYEELRCRMDGLEK